MLPFSPRAGEAESLGPSGGRQQDLFPWRTNSWLYNNFSFSYKRDNGIAVHSWGANCLYTKDCIAAPSGLAALR